MLTADRADREREMRLLLDESPLPNTLQWDHRRLPAYSNNTGFAVRAMLSSLFSPST
jgi:hypothetical protein